MKEHKGVVYIFLKNIQSPKGTFSTARSSVGSL